MGELISRLTQFAQSLGRSEYHFDADLVREARAKIESLTSRITELESMLEKEQWVSVSDRLPEERCFAYTPNDQDLGIQWRIIPEGLFKQVASDATDWKPLPSPPKGSN